jgi:choline dehydrogenase-like flavoprotein
MVPQGEYDVIVVGSGTGGATVALELIRRGRRVLVIERGKDVSRVGTFARAAGFYDANTLAMPRRSREGTILWHTFMAGGTSMVSCANGVRSLEGELARRGLDLASDLDDAERELGVVDTPEELLSDGSRAIREAAAALGHRFHPMPKFIRPEKCLQCGQCVLGCRYDARWTARESLEAALRGGADVRFHTRVRRVATSNGAIRGVVVEDNSGGSEIRADRVVLAAGGLETPVILQNSGIEDAGGNLFIDIQTLTYARTTGLNQVKEPPMGLVCDEYRDTSGFILSPFVNLARPVRMIEAGPAGFAMSSNRMLGIMTKQADDGVGRVFPDETVSKPLTVADRSRSEEGTAIAAEILSEAGADRSSIVNTVPAGSHAGGTAAIGTVVDTNLQTQIENLYVCDASVLPEAPGNPPILTIVALAKRLARLLSAAAPPIARAAL